MKKIIVLSLIFLLISCGRGGRFLKGNSREVVLVYSEDSKYSAGAIYKYLLRSYDTPQPETLLKVHPIKWENFKVYEDYRNKIILLLPNDSLWNLCNEEEGFFIRRDIFIKEDFVLIFCSYDSRSMLRIVSDNMRQMFDTLYIKMLKEVSKVELLAGIDMNIRKKIKDKFGFYMPIPKGWNIFLDRNDILILTKHNPDRFIMIFSKMGEEQLSKERIMDIRDSLTTVFYDGDQILREYSYSFDDNLGGVSALKIYGIWKNDSLMVGGPFLTYAFNYNGRFYFIDAGVYAPESNDKLGLILRLEGIIKEIRW